VGNNPEANAKTDKRPTVEVEIVCERWGSNNKSAVKIIEAPLVSDNAVRIDITLDLRNTGMITIRPVRRDLDDVEGTIADAERLANS